MIKDNKKRIFLRNVLILANAMELTKKASSQVSPAVCSADLSEDTKFTPSIVNWETFSNFASAVKKKGD